MPERLLAGDRVTVRPSAPPVVVFDLDGTLLDSAPGIVAGFQHALRSVGFPPPDVATLRADLGPPVEVIFTALGLPAADLGRAVAAYRGYYLDTGAGQSEPYDGVPELLARLAAAGVTLATATAKRTPLARAILQHHGLDHHFAVVNGTDELRSSKTETLTHTLQLLGTPPLASVVMVGDRHLDVDAARAVGVGAVAVRWGYGSAAELEGTGAALIEHPRDLVAIPPLSDWLAGRAPTTER